MSKHERKSLLLAEDDESLGRVLEIEFREKDYEVTWIRSLENFEKLPRSLVFEYAVVDLRLGNDSGLCLINLLKERSVERNLAVRIVVLTGYGSIPTAVEAVKRGASHYLTKPAKIEAIEKALLGIEPHRPDAPPETLAQHERGFIETTLLQEDGNITHAAKRLGIRRQSLQRKLKKFTP